MNQPVFNTRSLETAGSFLNARLEWLRREAAYRWMQVSAHWHHCGPFCIEFNDYLAQHWHLSGAFDCHPHYPG